MASGSPEHHMDRLGLRLGDRSCNFVLAAEERLGSSVASGFTTAQTGRTHDRTRPMAAATFLPRRRRPHITHLGHRPVSLMAVGES